jgi:hypothetical protein
MYEKNASVEDLLFPKASVLWKRFLVSLYFGLPMNIWTWEVKVKKIFS